MRALRVRCRDHAISTRGVLVSVSEQPGPCPSCGGPMLVQKSVQRHGVTLEHGAFEAKETVHVCKAGCRFANGLIATRRAQELAQCIPPRKIMGYDLMVYVGLQRYLQHRQREEIRAALKEEHGIELSSGEASILARRFLENLQALHEARAPALSKALAADGGWPLHVDATGESGRGTVLVAYTSWRSWVLGAWKIPTERADAILPHLREVVALFGAPRAVMRDLGKAMIPAVRELVGVLQKDDDVRVIVLSCHFHFLRDVGNDLLDPAHAKLRALFRSFKVRPRLRALARDLGRELGNELQQGRDALKDWRDDEEALHRVPEGRDGLAVVRGLAQWVLDYPAEATYGGSFPFDRPYLDLYDRCCTARRAAHAFLRRPPTDRPVRRTLERLLRIVDTIATAHQAAKVAETLRKRASLFDELRDTLRLVATPEPVASASPEATLTELEEIRADFHRWVEDLRQRRPERGPAEDTREAIDLVLDHIARHGASLWGHALQLPDEAGGSTRLVDRTNNCEENLFHEVKHGERRRSGRKVLTYDFESLPAAAFLTRNLEHDDYVAILCGSLDNLPAAFAAMEAQRASERRGQPPTDKISAEDAQQPIVSASLPTTDRRIVPSEAMDRRVGRAARSRAPQLDAVSR